MSKRIVNLRMIGRFGNNLFQYAFAKAYCLKFDCELRTLPWAGEHIFAIQDSRIEDSFGVKRSELDIVPGEVNIELNGYFQAQNALIYTRSQVREWFRWRPEVNELFSLTTPDSEHVIAHLRRGDYFGYGYPVVSNTSYFNACNKHGLNRHRVVPISEDHSIKSPIKEAPFAVDFYRLSTASTLLRANSSFSWWAATLADPSQKIFSPIVAGLEGGMEHDCEFVEGNWPRFSNHDFLSDLHLAP